MSFPVEFFVAYSVPAFGLLFVLSLAVAKRMWFGQRFTARFKLVSAFVVVLAVLWCGTVGVVAETVGRWFPQDGKPHSAVPSC